MDKCGRLDVVKGCKGPQSVEDLKRPAEPGNATPAARIFGPDAKPCC